MLGGRKICVPSAATIGQLLQAKESKKGARYNDEKFITPC
jgi:predicted nucleotide-binding protein (sugar kinase/HSP70/actin superfamily)